MTSRAEAFLGLKVLLGPVEPVEAALDVAVYFAHLGFRNWLSLYTRTSRTIRNAISMIYEISPSYGDRAWL